jgi:hypothetical protein
MAQQAMGGISMDLSLIYHKTENFRFYNAHPNGLKVKDCVVRAVCTAFEKDYMETRRELNRAKTELGFDSYKDHDFLRTWLEKLGYETIKFKAYEGEARKKVWEFLDEHMEGTYIVKVRSHISCIKDGELLDTWDCGYLTIYGAWRVK